MTDTKNQNFWHDVPISSFIVLGIGGLIAVVPILLVLLMWAFPIVSHDEVSRVTSPDGKVDCIVYERNGGATTSFVYWVYVKPSKEQEMHASVASMHGRVANLYGAIRNGGQFGVNTKWKDSTHLVVECIKADEVELENEVTVQNRVIHVELNQGVYDATPVPIHMAAPQGQPTHSKGPSSSTPPKE